MKETFDNLRCGFKYSLIALVLLLLFVVSMMGGIHRMGGKLVVPILVLPFVITFVWCYSLKKRYGAWKSLGQTNIAHAVISGGVLIVAFSFPLLGLCRLQSIVPISAIAWMSYTFLESQGLKQLKQRYGIDLSH